MLAVCTTISAMLLGGALHAAPPQIPENTPEAAEAAEAATAEQGTPEYLIPPHGYNSPAALAQALEALAAAHDGMSLIQIGHSPDGTPLRIASFRGPQFANTNAPGTPAILVVANLEGDRLVASETAMALCQHLATGEAAILRHAQVFVMPVANPDATAHAFAGLDPWRGAPTDDDRDGRLDEDGPADIDGDGRLLWMRVPRPDGTWLADKFDPRVSREANTKEAESGSFLLLREGSDADGDRQHVEDGPGGVAVDANFPHRWQQYAPSAGRFQLSEPESRALANFVLMHPSIAVAIVLDDEDNLANAPSGVEHSDKDSTKPLETDAALLTLLGKRFYAAEDIKSPRGAEHGAGNFADWLYFQRGILVLESALWSPPLDVKPTANEEAEEGAEKVATLPENAVDEHKLLLWADSWYRGSAFQEWQVFEHERFGAVDVGGWLPLVLTNPPAELLPALGTNLAAFVDSLADDLPTLQWSVEVTALDDKGVFEARAFLVGKGLLPTMTAMGSATRKQLPIRVTFELPSGGELLVGSLVVSVERLEGLGDNREFHWIYRVPEGSDSARIRATSKMAGEALMTLEVK